MGAACGCARKSTLSHRSVSPEGPGDRHDALERLETHSFERKTMMLPPIVPDPRYAGLTGARRHGAKPDPEPVCLDANHPKVYTLDQTPTAQLASVPPPTQPQQLDGPPKQRKVFFQ